MTEVARRPAGALAVDPGQQTWTSQQLAALQTLGIERAGRADLDVFLTYAQRTGLDPFARQIYLIGRKQWDSIAERQVLRWGIQVGIDGFRVIAHRSGLYEGQTPKQWCGPDGIFVDVWLSSEPPAAARVGVLRKGWRDPLYAIALFDEYAPRHPQTDRLLGLWGKMPALMLAKCAEALALRQSFPADLSGIYIPEEMDQRGPREQTVNTPPRTASQLAADIADAPDVQTVRELWHVVGDAGLMGAEVDGVTLRDAMLLRGNELEPVNPETPGAGEPQNGPAEGDAPARAAAGTAGSDPAPGQTAGEIVDVDVVDVQLPTDGDPWERGAPGAQF